MRSGKVPLLKFHDCMLSLFIVLTISLNAWALWTSIHIFGHMVDASLAKPTLGTLARAAEPGYVEVVIWFDLL